MKKFIAATFALAIFSFAANAQQTREVKSPRNSEMGQHKDRMMKGLDLTDAQKTEMKAAREAGKVKMDAIQSNSSLSDAQKQTQLKALKQEQQNKMQALLTPAQKASMEARKADMKEKGKMKDDKMKMRGDKKMNKEQREAQKQAMHEKLGLSNDQAAQLKALNEETRDKVKAIKSNSSLSQEQQKEQMKAVKASAKTRHEAILNKEQLKTMQDMKKQKHHKGMHHPMKESKKPAPVNGQKVKNQK